jgi:hypothetical protein
MCTTSGTYYSFQLTVCCAGWIGSVKVLCASEPKMAQTHYSFHSIASKPAALAYGTVVHDFKCIMTDSVLKLTACLINVKFSLA